MNARKLETNAPLQILEKVLSRGGWWTARELRRETGGKVDAVGSAISELRSNYKRLCLNKQIICERRNNLYYYRLKPLI